ncbi:tRNA nucleotidyltransferase [hydrothermal vent metagenome]|uniref:tRNA nucleotidyltransferase n=1 Tax=hydrothermal vent metagenome TaxID=652676 RepID=A0A1W1EJX0_9ZZZZ
MLNIKLPKIIYKISNKLNQLDAKAILVGGSLRDYFLNIKCKDYDIEVYGLDSVDTLIDILSKFGTVNLVGKSFGVLKFNYDGDEYDFSFPRRESKSALGHCGFDIECDGFLNFEEASSRRDFTINSMGYDIIEDKLLDPHNGYDDIKNRTIRYVNKRSFSEDALRVYRAIGFSARFEFDIDDDTKRLCKNIVDTQEFRELSKERVFIEFNKLLLKSSNPSIGFNLMREFGILKYFPPLKNIIDIPQDKRYHPEGDVWTHTMMAIDAMAKFENKNLKLLYATLCHDFGKATHTQIYPDKISAIGHEKAGIEPTIEFLSSLTNEHKFINSIVPLVEHHLKPSIYFRNSAKNSTIRKLATKVNIEELIVVAKADFLGRRTKEAREGVYKAGIWLLAKAKELEVDKEPLKPLIQGRDLILLGVEPSPQFRVILDKIYQMQLDGIVDSREKALEEVKNII